MSDDEWNWEHLLLSNFFLEWFMRKWACDSPGHEVKKKTLIYLQNSKIFRIFSTTNPRSLPSYVRYTCSRSCLQVTLICKRFYEVWMIRLLYVSMLSLTEGYPEFLDIDQLVYRNSREQLLFCFIFLCILLESNCCLRWLFYIFFQFCRTSITS